MTHDKLTIYLGFDSREPLAYDVARNSILIRSKSNIQIIPIGISQPSSDPIRNRPVERRDGKLWCPISGAPMATEFAIARFGVPFLKTKGWALFADCDIVCLADIAELFTLADPQYAVQVVKHDHRPVDGSLKMNDQVQTAYARKNWSSVVLWNCEHPAHRHFTLEAINTWPGRDLHAFKWLDDSEIGSLPPAWNHLVGVNEPAAASEIKIAHFTNGGPWFANWKGGPMDELWLSALAELN